MTTKKPRVLRRTTSRTINRTRRRSRTFRRRSNVRRSGTIVAGVAAIAIGAAWPWFASHRAQANGAASAPIPTDYRRRNEIVAFDEAALRRDPTDQITQRMLGTEYLQRFRE